MERSSVAWIVLQIDSYYDKCLMKVEHPGILITKASAAQYSEPQVTCPSVPLSADCYGAHDYRTSQRILPLAEIDCLRSAAKWSPPFPVCPEQLTAYRSFSAVRESRVEDTGPVELRSRASVEEDYVNEQHRVPSYEGLSVIHFIHICQPLPLGIL